MRITLKDDGIDSCELTETSISSSASFPIPTPKSTLQTGLREMLRAPDKSDVTVENVMISRYDDGLYVHSGNGRFAIPYRHLFALVLTQ